MNALADRLALAALRGVVAELEGDPAGAAEVLARLLARPADAGVAAIAARPAPAPAPPEAAPTRRRPVQAGGRPRAGRRDAAATDEARAILERLVAARGSVLAAAAAVGAAPALVRRWRSGQVVPSLESLTRLRAADPGAREEEGEGDEGEGGAAEGETSIDAPADSGERPVEGEAARLVAQLVARHGTLAAAAAPYGLSAEMLGRWARGTHASPSSLARLRAALASPPPPAPCPTGPAPRAAAAGEASAAPEEGAGEGAAEGDAAA